MGRITRGVRLLGLGLFLALASCSTQSRIPTVSDDALERLVTAEAERIVAVSEDRGVFSQYQIRLSDFPRKDVLGMSVGTRRIYISYELAKLASRHEPHFWLLRQTLAHEIAHETAGHALRTAGGSLNRVALKGVVSSSDVGLPAKVRLVNYSLDKELEADLRGLSYWQKLGWSCRVWVRILEGFEKQDYKGDAFHPTDDRLRQARAQCRTANAGAHQPRPTLTGVR